MNEVLSSLEKRLGHFHARQRLGIEMDHEAQIFGQGLTFFHIENWVSVHALIRAGLKLTGFFGAAGATPPAFRSATSIYASRPCRRRLTVSRCCTSAIFTLITAPAQCAALKRSCPRSL